MKVLCGQIEGILCGNPHTSSNWPPASITGIIRTQIYHVLWLLKDFNQTVSYSIC